MAKLTVAQMFAIASTLDAYAIEEIARAQQIKTHRIKQFQIARTSPLNAPQYMGDFWDVYDPSQTLESMVEALETTKPAKVKKIDTRPMQGGQPVPNSETWGELKGKKFVFTSAQNNTDVNGAFLDALESYCKHENARLLIGPFTYNKHGFQQGLDDEGEEVLHYDARVQPYLSNKHLILGELVWCGGLNILPTAKRPLSGFESLTGKRDSIIPHAKIALESIATAKIESAKIMYATGCVTQRNYVQRKAGQVAEATHCFGALVVECDANDVWHCRQIQADENNGFYDLNSYYTSTSEKLDSLCIEAVTLGDIHAEKPEPGVTAETIALLDELNPTSIFIHDLQDFSSLNHHNLKNPLFLHKTALSGDTMQGDFDQARDFLEIIAGDWSTYIVESNHDLAVSVLLNDTNYQWWKDTANCRTYLELQLERYIEAENPDFNMLEYALFRDAPHDITFLKTDQSFRVLGIECGVHGHQGSKGSRGSPLQFQKLNTPMNTGHTHAASIHGGVYTSGVTGNLNMGYNEGASDWSHSHTIIYPNGRRTIITLKPNGVGGYCWKA